MDGDTEFVLRKLDESPDKMQTEEKQKEQKQDEKEKEKESDKKEEPRYSRRIRKKPQLFGSFASPDSVEKETLSRSGSMSVPAPVPTPSKRKRSKKRSRKDKDEDDEDEFISSRSESYLASLHSKKKAKRSEMQDEKDEKDEKEPVVAEGKKKDKDGKAQDMTVPLVRPHELKPGTICAKLNLGRVTKTNEMEKKVWYKPLRDTDNEVEWWLRSDSPTEFVSTTRYRRTVELNKTDMAKQFMNCAVYPMRVSFQPIVNAESMEEQMKKYIKEVQDEKMSDKDFKQFVKKIIHIPERTMDCILIEKQTCLGYSLVDDLAEPCAPGKKHFKTVSHHAIQQIVHLETRYRLKKSKFEDPELEFIA